MTRPVALLIGTVAYVVSTVAAHNCSPCTCDEMGKLLHCVGVSSSTTNLDFYGKGITAVGSYAFAGMENLQTLYLDNNAITSLAPDSFDGLSKLVTLTLHQNAIVEMPNGIFDDLKSLEF
jgi:hypothetical protein